MRYRGRFRAVIKITRCRRLRRRSWRKMIRWQIEARRIRSARMCWKILLFTWAWNLTMTKMDRLWYVINFCIVWTQSHHLNFVRKKIRACIDGAWSRTRCAVAMMRASTTTTAKVECNTRRRLSPWDKICWAQTIRSGICTKPFQRSSENTISSCPNLSKILNKITWSQKNTFWVNSITHHKTATTLI